MSAYKRLMKDACNPCKQNITYIKGACLVALFEGITLALNWQTESKLAEFSNMIESQ